MQAKPLMLLAATAASLAGGAAQAAPIVLPALEVDTVSVYTHYFESMVDRGGPVQFGPNSAFLQSLLNATGMAWSAVQFRVIEDPNEVYAPGEFELVTFDPYTDPTADGETAPGLSRQFTLDYLEYNQVIRYTFENGYSHSLYETISYAFTVVNETGRDIGFGLQISFFPVPTPGTAAVLAMAGAGAMIRRRR
jgi:hypothetical protein